MKSKKPSRRTSDPRRRLLTLARYRAKLKGLAFSLLLDDFVIPSHCPVLGIPLRRGRGRPCDASPTLDRINPKRGYVRGNVQVISAKANRSKGDLTLDELLRLTAYMQHITT